MQKNVLLATELRGERLWAQNSNLSLLPDLHSLDLFKSQPVSGSIINPRGRRTGMSGNPLRDLDCAARIHVFGDARRAETVTTDSFLGFRWPSPVSQPASRDSPTIQAPLFQPFYDSCQRKEKVEHSDSTLERDSLSQKSTASLAFECTGTSCSFPRFSWNRNQRVPPRS